MPERFTPSVLTATEIGVDGKQRMDVSYLQKVLEAYFNSQSECCLKVTNWKVAEMRGGKRVEGEAAYKLIMEIEDGCQQEKKSAAEIIIGTFDQIFFQLEMMYAKIDG